MVKNSRRLCDMTGGNASRMIYEVAESVREAQCSFAILSTLVDNLPSRVHIILVMHEAILPSCSRVET